MRGVGLDFSDLMLEEARRRFADDGRVELVEHDLVEPLPALGGFDAVVSSMAIHHLEHERKRSLDAEVFDVLAPRGVFLSFEHVASPTQRLHEAFFAAIDEPLEQEDPSDRTLDVERTRPRHGRPLKQPLRVGDMPASGHDPAPRACPA